MYNLVGLTASGLFSSRQSAFENVYLEIAVPLSSPVICRRCGDVRRLARGVDRLSSGRFCSGRGSRRDSIASAPDVAWIDADRRGKHERRFLCESRRRPSIVLDSWHRLSDRCSGQPSYFSLLEDRYFVCAAGRRSRDFSNSRSVVSPLAN